MLTPFDLLYYNITRSSGGKMVQGTQNKRAYAEWTFRQAFFNVRRERSCSTYSYLSGRMKGWQMFSSKRITAAHRLDRERLCIPSTRLSSSIAGLLFFLELIMQPLILSCKPFTEIHTQRVAALLATGLLHGLRSSRVILAQFFCEDSVILTKCTSVPSWNLFRNDSLLLYTLGTLTNPPRRDLVIVQFSG